VRRLGSQVTVVRSTPLHPNNPAIQTTYDDKSATGEEGTGHPSHKWLKNNKNKMRSNIISTAEQKKE